MVAMFIVMLAGLFIVMAEIGMVLHPVRQSSRHMRPLMQVQYAEGVQGEGEGEE